MMAGEMPTKRRPSSSSSTTSAAAAVASLRNWFDKLRGTYTQQQQARRSSLILAALGKASGAQTPLLRAGVSMFNIITPDAEAATSTAAAAATDGRYCSSCVTSAAPKTGVSWLVELDHSPVKRPLVPLNNNSSSSSSSRPLSCYELTAADQQRSSRRPQYCETHFPASSTASTSRPQPTKTAPARLGPSVSVSSALHAKTIDIDRGHQTVEVAADRSDGGCGGSVGVSWQQHRESTGQDSVNNHQSTIVTTSSRTTSIATTTSSSSCRHAAAVAITTSCIDDSDSQQQQRLDDDDDAMTDTWPLDLWADLSLPHIDSDVSDCEECSPFYFSEIRRLPKSTATPVTNSTSTSTPTSSVNDDSVRSSSSENNQQTEPIIVNQEGDEMPNDVTLMEDPTRPSSAPTEATLTSAPTPPSSEASASALQLSVETLGPYVMDCGVYLPGVRHRGRALIVAELAPLQSHLPSLNVDQLVQLVTYYQAVPRKSAAKNGLTLLVVGPPNESPEAFALIEQLLSHQYEQHHQQPQRKYIDDVVIWSEGDSTCDTPLRLSGRSCDVISSSSDLRERLAAALTLGCCGGPLVHNQHDWIAFRKIVEPFLSSCRQRSKIINQVINSVRKMSTANVAGGHDSSFSASSSSSSSSSCSSPSSSFLLEELEAVHAACAGDPELVRMMADGPKILQEVGAAKLKLGDNVDARETMERCSALYAEVQRSVGRLARVCERRKAQLEKHLLLMPHPHHATTSSTSSSQQQQQNQIQTTTDSAVAKAARIQSARQILSWLCRKGEETLSRYQVTLAESLASAKSQEREFQRFLTLAQKQIIKGKELLEDLQRDCALTGAAAAAAASSAAVVSDKNLLAEEEIEETTTPPIREEEMSTGATPTNRICSSPSSSKTSTMSSGMSRARSSSSSILDLASSLQTQLSKFGHRLDDTRERLEDTSRCYELLDKAYEWGVEAMKLASKLKMDQQPCPLSVATHLLNQVDQLLLAADKTPRTAALDDLNALARKLDNPKLLDQCKLAENRCIETLELLEFRRSILNDYVKEEESKRQHHQQQQQQQEKVEIECKIYENVTELNEATAAAAAAAASSSALAVVSEDKVDGLLLSTGSKAEYHVWKKSDAATAASVATGSDCVLTASGKSADKDGGCVLLRVKKNNSSEGNDQQQQSAVTTSQNVATCNSSGTAYPLRGTTSYSSGTSLSSYASSSTSWSSRMKMAMHRKMSTSSDPPTTATLNVNGDTHDNSAKDKNNGGKECSINDGGSDAMTVVIRKEETEEDESEQGGEEVSVCQSPISVNSHLQCRASSIDLSLPIAEMQEAGFTQDDIKSQKNLLLVMREMIQTERDYVRSLEYIIENYIPELSREDIPQAMRGKRNVIFGNIEKIYGFHHHYFLRELEHCHNLPFLVGQCFLRHEQHFYLYALYNKNKPKSDALMAEYGTAFFRRKQMELGDKMDLASYLLKPVQRMGKYALLLKQLLKESGDKEPEFVDLLAAEQMVRFQLRHGNDLLAMDSLRDCDVNVKEQGRLLRQNEFYCWQGRKKGLRHVFLFEDLILFSKSKRDPERKNLDIYIYKQSMKTSDIGFTAKMGDSSTRFEIWFRKRKPNETIVMEATNSDVKEAWVEDISRILWKQALRNRELRMAEMAEMGIGNKPCLDIRPSQDQISDRSISYAQLSKAPKFRHSVCGSIISDSRSSKRPHSIISVSSSASSASSSGSGSVNNDNRTNSSGHQDSSPSNALMANLHRSKTNQSQCSAESGILADLSMSYDDPESSGHCRVGRSDSSITTESADSVTLSPSSPLTSSKSCPYPSLTPVSLYVNNKLIPITPSPSHKNMPMTEM